MNKLITATILTSVALTGASHAQSVLDDLDPLVVTGSNYLEKLSDAPVRTELLDSKAIEQTQCQTLAQAVEYSPGLRVDNACQNCNQQALQMLGLPQQYIGILSDGLPNFSSLAGVYGIEQIPAGLIGRIEIVKGGGSVLYGPGAVAGVINIIPRDPQQTGATLHTRYSDHDGTSPVSKPALNSFLMADFVNDDGTFKLTAFGNYNYMRPLDLNGDNFTDVSERELWAGGFRAVWSPNDFHKLSLDYFYSSEDRRGGESGSAFHGPKNLALITKAADTRRNVFTLKWLANFNEQWSTQLAYSYALTDRDTYYGGTAALGSPDPASPYYDPAWDPQLGFGSTENKLHFVDFLANYSPSDKHRFSFGFQYRHESLADTQDAAGRNIDLTYENVGLLLQHRWKPTDQWILEYGARADFHSELDDPVFSPRASVMYKHNEDFRIRGAVSTGFRAPEVFDEDLHIANVGGELQVIHNDPNLSEEKAVTVSLSPEWNITNKWRLELNLFHTWLDDTFAIEPNDDPSTPALEEYARTNGPSSRIYGSEFNLGYFEDNWRVEFSWIQQRMEYDSPQLLLGDDSFSDPADNPVLSSTYAKTPESLGLLKFTYQHEWFDTFIAVKATGPMDVPHIVSNRTTGDLVENRLKRTDWFFDADIGISREFEMGDDYTLTLNLGVKNVFNEFQSDLDKGEFRDAGYTYGPAFPRTCYIGAKLEF